MIQKSIEGTVTPVMEHLLNQMILLQREFFLGAGLYEGNESREGYANGYKPLTIKSPQGKLAVQIPQVPFLTLQRNLTKAYSHFEKENLQVPISLFGSMHNMKKYVKMELYSHLQSLLQ